MIEWSLFLVALMPDRTLAFYPDEAAYARGAPAHTVKLPNVGTAASPLADPPYNYENAICVGLGAGDGRDRKPSLTRRLSTKVGGVMMDAHWALCPDTHAESESWLASLNSPSFESKASRLSEDI